MERIAAPSSTKRWNGWTRMKFLYICDTAFMLAPQWLSSQRYGNLILTIYTLDRINE